MHTFKGKSCYISFNSDYSGQAIISNKDNESIEVDCADLLNFCIDHIGNEVMSDIVKVIDDSLNKQTTRFCRGD